MERRVKIRRVELRFSVDGQQCRASCYVVRRDDSALCIRGTGWSRAAEAEALCRCLPPEQVDGQDELSRLWYLRLLSYYKLVAEHGPLTTEEAAALASPRESPDPEEAAACLGYLADEGYVLPPGGGDCRHRLGKRRLTDR